MKRTAAILGPTPAFLSWTIALPCPFRDPDAKKPVDAAFRELRSLRAIAVGELEGRIVDGFCLHPDSANPQHSDAAGLLVKGFPVDEVYAAFGGQEKAAAACGDCPANVPVSLDELQGKPDLSKAGCFGWLPFGPLAGNTSDFLNLLEVETEDGADKSNIVDAFEAAIQSTNSPNPFPQTSPAWFGVWSCGSFSKQQLEFLNQVCPDVRCHSIAWQRLAVAIQQAYTHDLRFTCSLMPNGHSDGTNWVIESQCPTCGDGRTDSPCSTCRDETTPLQSRRMRVLGLRPYLNLVSIVGEEGAQELCQTYRRTSELGETE